MKKAKDRRTDDLRPEYRKSDFPRGLVRGKYASARVTVKVVRLEPEIAAAFPTSEAVNKALGNLLQKSRSTKVKSSTVPRAKPKRIRAS